MNHAPRTALAAGMALAGLLGLGQLSRVPYVTERANHALLRLAWRTRGDRVQECRHRTPEELARLPRHMREDEVCEGRVLPYSLGVMIDGVAAVDAVERGAGARQDRPIYVYHEVPLLPGPHRVLVSFARQGKPGEEVEVQQGREQHVEPERGAVRASPPLLTLDTTIVLRARDIALITYDPEARRLILKRSS